MRVQINWRTRPTCSVPGCKRKVAYRKKGVRADGVTIIILRTMCKKHDPRHVCMARPATEARMKALKLAREAAVDWASDPCARCGRWPLSIFNKTGYCDRCGRGLGSKRYTTREVAA